MFSYQLLFLPVCFDTDRQWVIGEALADKVLSNMISGLMQGVHANRNSNRLSDGFSIFCIVEAV